MHPWRRAWATHTAHFLWTIYIPPTVINRGAEIEHHPLFPERTNVQFAQIIGRDHIRMRVWERGTGLTLASGSSSCATAVAAVRRGLTSHSVKIELDGGILHIDWRKMAFGWLVQQPTYLMAL